MLNKIQSRWMFIFAVIWLGQTISLIGSGLTGFALGLWVYQSTGSAMQFGLIALSSVLPRIFLSPLAGVLVDRWDRRWAMILSDCGAAVSTLIIAVLFFGGQLEVWHIYVATAVNAAFGTLQWPAYSATTALLVPHQNLGRANGLIQFSQAASEILAPLLAGILLLTIQVKGVLLIDFMTFLFAVVTLLLINIPKKYRIVKSKTNQGSLLQEAAIGWKYIKVRPGLYGLLMFFAVVNFLWGMLGVLLPPMILEFASAEVLGAIISIAGFGMLSGSVAMSLWGGPKRRAVGILIFELVSGIGFIVMGLRPLAWLVALGAFCAHVTIAIVAGSNQALWQSKVSSEVQGRVFATQQMVAKSATPLAILLAGFLADYVFEPLFNSGGGFVATAGKFVGDGPGRGIALLIIIMGVVKISVSLAGMMNPRIRYVDDELPDAIVPASSPSIDSRHIKNLDHESGQTAQ